MVSIEITGSDLDYRKDRVMVINCQDTCGRAEPSEYVFPKDKDFVDALAVNDKAYSGELPVMDPYTVDGMYTEYEDRFCRLNNLMSGSPELVTQNLCYPKCSSGCTGHACFCDGFYQGFDTEESAALCLPRVECEHLCTLLGDACFGIDMHESANRCFLNGPGCAAQLAAGRFHNVQPPVRRFDIHFCRAVQSMLLRFGAREVRVHERLRGGDRLRTRLRRPLPAHGAEAPGDAVLQAVLRWPELQRGAAERPRERPGLPVVLRHVPEPVEGNDG